MVNGREVANGSGGQATFSHGRMLGMSAYWAGSNFLWGALFIVLIANQVRTMAPERPAAIVGLMMSLGAIPALVVPLIVGAMSDRCTARLGRRRPYIVFGSVATLVFLACMHFSALASSAPLYVLSYFLLQVGNNTAMGAYSGVIPDLVVHGQRGMASGYMAAMCQVGTLAGVVAAGQLVEQRLYGACYLALGAVVAITLAITLFGVKEVPLAARPAPLSWKQHLKRFWIDPRKHSDFAWVWITRALVMLGFYGLMPYLHYFLADVIGDPTPAKTTGLLSAIILVTAMFSGLFGGLLSDRIGRKRVVYAANTFMAVICVIFGLTSSLPAAAVMGGLFGLGYGAYISVDWALGTDVLPSKEEAAKDMGIWHIAMTLPQAIASAPAAMLLGSFGMVRRVEPIKMLGLTVLPTVKLHYTQAGFATLFAVAGVFILLGAVLLRNVRGVR